MAERPVRIITKRTAVPGKIPTGTTGTELNLIKAGELASNLADKKLFSYDGSNIFEFGSKSFLGLTGGTVSGETTFQSGITVNTISDTSYIDFNTSPSVPSPTGGTLYYDSNENALSYKPLTNQNDVTVNLGQESLVRVYNNSGAQINNGQVVHITGSTSGTPTVALANASKLGTTFTDGLAQSSGVATHNIPNGEYGFITNFGIVRDLDTSTFIVGRELFLSDTIDGGITDDPDSIAFTSRISVLGWCLTSDAVNGKIYVKIENENQLQSLTQQEVNVLLGNTVSTGAYEYTGATTASTTTFNVAPMRGWLVSNTYSNATNPDVINVYYTGGTNISLTNIGSADSTYLLVNSGATLYQQTTFPTPQQRRENIYLGKVNHPNRTSILNINNTVDYDVSPMSSLRDLWSPIRLINQGIIPSPNGANLSFNTSAGSLWGNGINWSNNQLSPNNVNIAAKVPASFTYRTQTGGTSSSVTVIDPTKYDIGGVITSISPAGSNDATNQRIYLYPTGVINVLYGQTRYATLVEAISSIQSETFIPYPNAESTGILIGVISVRNDIVADGQPLTNPDYAKFTLVSKFGESFGGTGGLSTTTLQQAYNNSTNPEITTNSTLKGVQFKGGTGSDLDANIVIENNAGVVTGQWLANGGLSATSISATTYYNLPTDVYITGGTYDNSNGTAIFGNSTGGTFNVNGFTTGDTYWTSGSVGSFSVKIDNNSGLDATGDRAVASGNNTLASGSDSFAQNGNTIAFGNYSHAEGYQTKTVGLGSHSEGGFTLAGWKGFSASSVVSGLITISNNVDYTSEFTGSTVLLDSKFYAYNSINYLAPDFTIQLDDTSINAGISVADASNLNSSSATTFNGLYSHAEGRYTTALGNESHAEGSYTTAAGEHSRSEGLSTVALGISSHAQGGATTAVGDYSHSEGIGSIAFGSTSHAEGGATTAIGDYSHSEGGATTAVGAFSHASGSGSTASGITSFVHSSNSFAIGDRSVVLGGQNITGTTDDTVYVSNLNVYNIPTLNNSNTEILSRNSSNGNVEYTQLSAFTYITGYTYSPTTNTFTIKQNQGQPDITASFNSVSGFTVDGSLTVTGNTVLQSVTGTSAQINGNTTITNGLVRIQGNSSNELVRITQLGSGNAFVVEDSTNPDTSPFVIDSSGFVGIGVETPTNPLHISGSTDQIKLSNGSSVWTVASKSNGDFVAVASGTRASMYFGSYGTTNSTRIGSNGAIIVNSPSDSLFTGNGSVGIGISAPETKLHVSGNTIISGILSGGTMVITTTPASSTSTQILMRNSESGQIEITDSTSPAIYNFGMTYAISSFNFLT